MFELRWELCRELPDEVVAELPVELPSELPSELLSELPGAAELSVRANAELNSPNHGAVSRELLELELLL